MRMRIIWAIVRVILGIAQMTGAIVSAVLLLRVGIAYETFAALIATSACTAISLFLFRVLKVQTTHSEAQ